MALFKGNVKPYVVIDGLGIRLNFGETVNLAEWQTANPNFKFALKNKWVISADRKALLYNTLESKKMTEKNNVQRHNEIVSPANREIVKEVSGIDPAVLNQVLEKQAIFLRSVQQSYDSLKQEVKENKEIKKEDVKIDMSPFYQALSALQEQQKQIVEQINKTDNSHLFTALLHEIRNLSLSQQPQESQKTVELLSQIQKTLENTKTQVIYNNSGTGRIENQSEGFRIQDFEEKYVPKVEDLNVKDSKIVTQQTQSGSVDDALAALKKLKNQMKK
jgi:hypothetical protein